MSRTIRTRKDNGKKKWWAIRHRRYFFARNEEWDERYRYKYSRKGFTYIWTKVELWSEWVKRDGNICNSYRQSYIAMAHRANRATERAVLHSYVADDNDNFLFRTRKDNDLSWDWD
jgi:hypothetical protein